jgi:hypothetical protein
VLCCFVLFIFMFVFVLFENFRTEDKEKRTET